MKVNIVIPAAVMVSVVLFGIVKIRKKELDKEDKRSRFHEIKLRVTGDVLKEYENEKAEMQNLLQKLVSDEKALEDEVNMLISRADEIRGEVDNCQGGQKSAKDELSIAETEFSNLKAEQDQEMSSWKTEVEALKKTLSEKSLVCNFLKKGSQGASKLCGIKVIDEAAKKEAKQEASKQEQPKAKAPKKEEPKMEEPNQEEPKGGAPNQEEPKGEVPKQEEPKGGAPNQEEPKREEPNQEEPKVEEPKQEEPKGEEPKQEEPKVEARKGEAAKQQEPKPEVAKEEHIENR